MDVIDPRFEGRGHRVVVERNSDEHDIGAKQFIDDPLLKNLLCGVGTGIGQTEMGWKVQRGIAEIGQRVVVQVAIHDGVVVTEAAPRFGERRCDCA